jgi:glycosyltransferase involved in cell wall biosynthesis
MIVGELAPYRLHFHRRVAREIHALELRTILHFDTLATGWAVDPTPDVGPVVLGHPRYARAGTLARLVRQVVKARALVRWLRGHAPAAVVVGGYAYLPSIAAILWCRARRVPVLLWADSNIHGDRARGLKRLLKRAALTRLLARVNAVLVCGSLGAAYFQRYGVSRERIFYCPNEPDYTLYDPSRPAAPGPDLPGGRRRFVCSGRLILVKRFGDAIDAFVRVADVLPEWDLVIVGDGPMRSAWEARVPERLRGRVRFLGFVADQETLAGIYRRCDCLVAPSAYEAWALVLNEAAAAGLAIIASDVVGAAPELVRPGVNGEIVPVGDVDALVDAMRRTAERIDEARAASPGVLREWRDRADPVAGLRAALRAAGVTA